MIQQIIEKYLHPAEEFVYGLADVQHGLGDVYSEYPSAISIGKKLDDEIIDAVAEGPTHAYRDHYDQVNNELSDIAFKISDALNKKQIKTCVIEPTVATASKVFQEFLKTLRYPFSHKMIATRAGLGWIGKTDLLVSKEFGPRLRLTSILLDQSIQAPVQPIDRSRCGQCDVCVIQCPAGAANGDLWDIHTDRDLFYDVHKCRQMCRKLSMERLGIDKSICGICVSVCPVGKKNKEKSYEKS